MSFRGDAPAVKHEAVAGRVSMMTPLILKRAALSRSSGQWDDDAYDVLEKRRCRGSHLPIAGCAVVDVGERARRGTSSAPRTASSRRARKRWRRSQSRGGASETSPAGIGGSRFHHTFFWIQSPCVRNFTFAAPSET
jgi:hypothetical protein